MNATKVLCVENHPEYMGALKYMLEAAGCEVMAATTGGQGLRLLTDLHIDGVLPGIRLAGRYRQRGARGDEADQAGHPSLVVCGHRQPDAVPASFF